MTLAGLDVLAAENAAHWRAMPVSRLLDGGMQYADVVSLEGATSEGKAWDVTLERTGLRRLDRAGAASSAGHRVTAAGEYRAAAAAFAFAQMAINTDTARKLELYEGFVGAVREAGRLAPRAVNRIELPFQNGALVGWQVQPVGDTSRGTVIVFGGQSGWGATYLRYADALGDRGLTTILAEGPGQGETRMRHHVYLDVDVTAAYGEFVAYARTLDSGPVGLWGNSMGGLYAALTAAANSEVDAVCINGGLAERHLMEFRAFREQAGAMLGSEDASAIEENFRRLRFDAGRHRIECPVLVVHGGADPLVRLEDQQPFLEAARSEATLKVWDDGNHTIYNHSDERNNVVTDWFADQFSAGTAR
ncbi:alpha/beta hydrolase [Paeniglutamicibacter sp. MACA_103]|uniref:alpha/beta hydrolase n=1 Tax=Paeniglutamicibacter sp. MACA_103 TaxID=3377337 RepID=UPI00389627DB